MVDVVIALRLSLVEKMVVNFFSFLVFVRQTCLLIGSMCITFLSNLQFMSMLNF